MQVIFKCILLLISLTVCNVKFACGNCGIRERVDSNREVFAFFNGCKKAVWSKFPWYELTTIAVGNCYDPEFICTAHQHGVKVVIFGTYPVEDLLDEQKRLIWVNNKLKIVQDNDMDGLNIDFEDPLVNNSAAAHALTELALTATQIFHQASSKLQISFDFAWAPGCVDKRCYDYLAISQAVDLVFVMAYDEQSQIFDKHCTAKPNSGIQQTRRGVQEFLDLGVTANKIILGLPWYGYDYTCLKLSRNNSCEIKEVPFRGVNCSDAAGRQIQYAVIAGSLLAQSTTGRLWDDRQQTPYFNYKKSPGIIHQVWYDDEASLTAKYGLVSELGLRGAGMWSAEQLDYSDTEQGRKQRQAMWRAISPHHYQSIVV